jgi:hypothetical protein
VKRALASSERATGHLMRSGAMRATQRGEN